MKLSVIIVNYNVKYFLEQCLHSVLNASGKMETEVLVVDNNSVDGSMDMVSHKFPTVRCICNKENVGFSKANNQGIRQAKGEYILLLNPDTVVEEDTFEKTVAYMDQHSNAGALGVKMIDGSGRFLPESKRGLPTPSVAFFKISGLTALFPKSKVFGRYHLRYLDENEIHEVEVLAGAFMLIRATVLEKIGLLDEDFFMYGEDIDLSYRIVKSGYKNIYYPHTRIIHYKGESTRKTSVNYVLVFYNAMIIFARKHFSRQHASLFSFLIHGAIYLRASVALLSRFLKKMSLPILDATLLLGGMYFLKEYWSRNMVVNYPEIFMLMAVPGYILIWIVSVYFSGGYEQPVRLPKIIRGIFSGTILILVIYALLPEIYRFSRALILLGAVWASIAMIVSRLVINMIGWKGFTLESDNLKRLLIAGGSEEATRVLSLLKLSGSAHNFIGFATPEATINNAASAKPPGEFDNFTVGTIDNLKEIIEVYKIDEVIFCARDISSNQIIRYMSLETTEEVEFKIAPPESLFIIGSSSVDNPGELYVIDINSISRNLNRRNKRLFDMVFSLLCLVTVPVGLFTQREPRGFLQNIFRVLGGKSSWVGYHYLSESGSGDNLPPIRPGVLTPLDSLKNQHLDPSTINRLNGLYAKDYRVYADLNIIRLGFKNLGRKPVFAA